MALEVEFTNFTKATLFPALHDRIPLEEQSEALREFLIESMNTKQILALEVEENGLFQQKILNRANVNAVSVFVAEPDYLPLENRPAWERREDARPSPAH